MLDSALGISRNWERTGWRTVLQTGIGGAGQQDFNTSIQQCVLAAKRTNPIQHRGIQHSITNKQKRGLSHFSALVRPHLEQDEQFCASQDKNDVKVLECVQIRSTKLVTRLKGMSYVELLKTLGLSGLGKRRLRGNIIATYSF